MVQVLPAGDEFAYSKVMSRIGEAGTGTMVADPYIGFEEVLDLARSTGVTRILAAKRGRDGGKKRLEAIRAGVLHLKADRVIQVRVAGKELHDRFVIPAVGPVTMIGMSLNGVGSTVTIITPIGDQGGAVRDAYEELWDAAEVLATSVDPVDGDDGEGEGPPSQ